MQCSQRQEAKRDTKLTEETRRARRRSYGRFGTIRLHGLGPTVGSRTKIREIHEGVGAMQSKARGKAGHEAHGGDTKGTKKILQKVWEDPTSWSRVNRGVAHEDKRSSRRCWCNAVKGKGQKRDTKLTEETRRARRRSYGRFGRIRLHGPGSTVGSRTKIREVQEGVGAMQSKARGKAGHEAHGGDTKGTKKILRKVGRIRLHGLGATVGSRTKIREVHEGVGAMQSKARGKSGTRSSRRRHEGHEEDLTEGLGGSDFMVSGPPWGLARR